MLIVYVKHYLTVGGMVFFQDWLQRVKSIMSQQNGYASVIHNASSDNDVCVNIIVKFENE